MEGVGSRLGRSSSRYGPSATATVLNGPVRKWKRKWVHVSPSPTLNYRNNSHSNGNSNNNNGSRLLLCRWTPLPPSAAAAATSPSEDPPKRKFRYTPVRFGIRSVTSVLSKRVLIHGSEMNDISFGEMSKQDSNMKHLDLDLDLRLKGLNSDLDSVGQSEEDQVKKASSGGFWTSD
ncbi:hypothetical protein D5086_003138 [Populus alba]|uniref:Uncharacterized protein n=1 Tax=Populus alba TaxID=43335 RepID=A0ACC4D3X3_POPAL